MTRFLVILFVTQGTDGSYICEAARLLTMEDRDLGSFCSEISKKLLTEREIPEFNKIPVVKFDPVNINSQLRNLP